MPVGEVRVAIKSDQDIVLARQKGRVMAIELGFSSGEATLIATTISELARNIISYAGEGQILLKAVQGTKGTGLSVTAADEGPGIPDIQQAMRDGDHQMERLMCTGVAIEEISARGHAGSTKPHCNSAQRSRSVTASGTKTGQARQR